jgi:hypothetical protein
VYLGGLGVYLFGGDVYLVVVVTVCCGTLNALLNALGEYSCGGCTIVSE